MSIPKRLTIIAFTLATMWFIQGVAPASAANGLCPAGTSLFGAVREVNGNTLLVKTIGVHGFEKVSINGATINRNNLTLHPGVFVGAFGCFTEDYASFKASKITLAYNAATYPGGDRDTETLTGGVRSVADGRILTETGKPHGFVEIRTSDTAGVKVNDRLRAVGLFNPDGTFTASRVEDLSRSPQPVSHLGVCPTGTSLFGTVREIQGKTLLVKTIGARGFEKIATDDATIHANGLTLHPGVFIGAFGCFTSDFRRFDASEVTLARSEDTYPNERHTQTLSGVIRSLGDGRMLVETGTPYGDVTIITSDTAGAKVGRHVEVTGSFNPNGTFVASKIEFGA